MDISQTSYVNSKTNTEESKSKELVCIIIMLYININYFKIYVRYNT